MVAVAGGTMAAVVDGTVVKASSFPDDSAAPKESMPLSVGVPLPLIVRLP